MINNNPTQHKARTSETHGAANNNSNSINKPATMELCGRLIDATHHFTGPGDKVLHLYLGARTDGIDISIPIASDKPAYARTDRGRRALGLDDHGPELVTDRGECATCPDCESPTEWQVHGLGDDEIQMQCDDCMSDDTDDDDDQDDGGDPWWLEALNPHDDDHRGTRLMTDGGRDEPAVGEPVYRYGDLLGHVDRIEPASEDKTRYGDGRPCDPLTEERPRRVVLAPNPERGDYTGMSCHLGEYQHRTIIEDNEIPVGALDWCDECGDAIIREADGPHTAEPGICGQPECTGEPLPGEPVYEQDGEGDAIGHVVRVESRSGCGGDRDDDVVDVRPERVVIDSVDDVDYARFTGVHTSRDRRTIIQDREIPTSVLWRCNGCDCLTVRVEDVPGPRSPATDCGRSECGEYADDGSTDDDSAGGGGLMRLDDFSGARLMTDGGEPVNGDGDELDVADLEAQLADIDIDGSDDETDDDDVVDVEMMRALEENAEAHVDDSDADGGDDGWIRNSDGVRVASTRGGFEGLLAPGANGRFECSLCEAVTESEHGAKSHFGRVHPQCDDADVEARLNNADPVVPDDTDDADDVGQPEPVNGSPGTGAGHGDDEEIGGTMDETDMPQAWRDALNAYKNSRVQSSPTTRADARDKVVEALSGECDWLSIVERCEAGKHYHLVRWDDEEGWTPDAGAYIGERTAATLGSIASDTEIGHYVSQLARRNFIAEETVNGAERDAVLVPVKNGTLNLGDVELTEDEDGIPRLDPGTVELEDMKQENRFLYRIETAWDPDDADVDGLDEWLSDVIPDANQMRVVTELVGHALHPRYPTDAFGVFVGQGGSGKSQTLETVKAMLGGDNVAVRTLKAIEESDFASDKPVPNMRANINTELAGEQLKSISTLKTYSAGEELEIEPKGEPSYKGKNDATMLFASDDPPRMPNSDGDRALGRRLHPVEFPCTYEEDPDPDDPLQLQSRGKREVQEELQSDERLKALLYVAAEGLARLLDNGGITDDRHWKDRIAEYESYSDPSHDFARHALEPAEDGAIETGDLKQTFDAFAQAHDHAGKTVGQIVDVLEEMPQYPIAKGRTRSFSDRQELETMYKGVAFNQQALNAWVPEAARHLYRDNDEPVNDDADGYASETLAEIRQDSELGRRDAVKVTVNESSSWTSYDRHEEGVLQDGTDSVRYYVQAPGISLEKDETYIIDAAIAIEESDDTKLQLVPGMTDTTRVVRGDEDGQDDLDTGDDDDDNAPNEPFYNNRADDTSDDTDADESDLSQAERREALVEIVRDESDDGTAADLHRVVERAVQDTGLDPSMTKTELDVMNETISRSPGKVELLKGGA